MTERFIEFIEEIASCDDWEYGNGESMSSDATATLSIIERYRTALEQIANLVNITQTRGFSEHWFTPDHLVDEDGWGPIHPMTKQGLRLAAKMAQRALE